MNGKHFGGILYFASGWRATKAEIQKEAKWYRERGYNARVVPEREYEPGRGYFGRKGYALYTHGMQNHPKAQALRRRTK